MREGRTLRTPWWSFLVSATAAHWVRASGDELGAHPALRRLSAPAPRRLAHGEGMALRFKRCDPQGGRGTAAPAALQPVCIKVCVLFSGTVAPWLSARLPDAAFLNDVMRQKGGEEPDALLFQDVQRRYPSLNHSHKNQDSTPVSAECI